MKALLSSLVVSAFVCGGALQAAYGDNAYGNYNRGNGNPRMSYNNPQMMGQGVVGEICNAINSQRRIEIILKNIDVSSTKEMKITMKRVVVEPYALGMTDRGPILQGNVVDEENIKEVIVKTSRETFNQQQTEEGKDKGWSGWFGSSSEDGNRIDLTKVEDFYILNDTFEVPSSFKGFDDKNIQTLCQVPLTSNSK